jgi:hypothetical protein
VNPFTIRKLFLPRTAPTTIVDGTSSATFLVSFVVDVQNYFSRFVGSFITMDLGKTFLMLGRYVVDIKFLIVSANLTPIENIGSLEPCGDAMLVSLADNFSGRALCFDLVDFALCTRVWSIGPQCQRLSTRSVCYIGLFVSYY